MIAHGYIRVSTDKQAAAGNSLDAQKERIIAYCTMQKLGEPIIYADEGESAKTGTLDRPALVAMLEIAKRGDAIVVAKLDRITRSVKNLCELTEAFEKKGLEFVSIAEGVDTTTTTGRLVLNIMASVSQWEREAISERTSIALLQRMKDGKKPGGTPPFGWRNGKDKMLLVDDKEQMALELIYTMRDLGFSIEKIADHLSFHPKIYPPRGATWWPKTVFFILKRRNEDKNPRIIEPPPNYEF